MAKANCSASKANGAALDFESRFWAAADKMRGHRDANLSPRNADSLTATLEEQFTESAKLEKAIRQNLKALSHA